MITLLLIVILVVALADLGVNIFLVFRGSKRNKVADKLLANFQPIFDKLLADHARPIEGPIPSSKPWCTCGQIPHLPECYFSQIGLG